MTFGVQMVSEDPSHLSIPNQYSPLFLLCFRHVSLLKASPNEAQTKYKINTKSRQTPRPQA
jgi:hypothetical protein